MTNNCCVYIHINKLTNKAYIGITSQVPEDRWQKGRHYKTCVLFNRAIQKYGWDNFEHIIFKDNLSREEANHIEYLLIALFNTNNPTYGYNLQSGGKSYHHAESTKCKIREKAIGRTKSKEECLSISKRTSGENNPRAKEVECLNNGMKFSTAKEAGNYYNIDYSGICSCCNGKMKFCGKDPITKEHLVWIYTENNISDAEKQKLLINAKGYSNKIVKCITTNEYFYSLREACEKYHLSIGNLSRACRQNKPCGKSLDTKESLYWCYEEK